MPISDFAVGDAQKAYCDHQRVRYTAAPGDSKLGFALSTQGLLPINGLRHPPVGDTNGWYIWCGEEYSDAANFFAPLHAKHVYEDHPELIKLLGLPPGYRFLLAGDYLDIWYDPSLLNV